MFLLNVTFLVPPAMLAAHLPAHGSWVERQFADGLFLCAGPKRNGSGGAILVTSLARADLQALIAQDPLVRAAVAEYQIIDFDCQFAAPAHASLRGA